MCKLIEVCELAKRHLDALRLESGIGRELTEPEQAAFQFVDTELCAALEAAGVTV